MTARERLIELLRKSEILCNDCGDCGNTYCTEAIADLLLTNGVIVLPCKVGDVIYEISTNSKRVVSFKVSSLIDIVRWIEDEAFGIWLFTSKEEAEKAIAERRKNEK